MAEGAKDSVLDILDPAVDFEFARDNDAARRESKVFWKGVEAGDKRRNDGYSDGMDGLFFVEVGGEGIVESDVGDSGKEAAVQSRWVAEEAGVGVDGENGGDDLRKEKGEKRCV